MKSRKIFLVSILAVLSVFLLATASFAYTLDQIVPTAVTPTSPTNVAGSQGWVTPNPDTTYKLFLSNNPEDVYSSGVLARESAINGTGKFRVFWSHQNKTGGSAYIGFGLKNTSAQSLRVYLGKRAFVQNGSATPVLGQTLLRNWLQSSSSEYLYATIAPGQYTYIGFLNNNNTFGAGMYDVIIRDTNGSLYRNGIQARTYLSYNPDPGSLMSSTTTLAGDSYGHTRGMFDHATKSLTWNSAGTDTQIVFIRFSNATYTTPANDIHTGWSESDNRSVTNWGNYGQDLNITVNLSSNSALLLYPNQSADGNSGWNQNHYLAATVSNRGTVASPVIPASNGWVAATGYAGNSIQIQTSLPANEAAPLHLVIRPN